MTIQYIDDQGFEAEDAGSGGITVHDINNFGHNASEQAYRSCADPRSNLIGSLYDSIRINPQNEDTTDLLLSCYKRVGLVDQDMTSDQLRSMDTSVPPWNPPSDDVIGCLNDPLHYST